jgi:hypothetical protein
LRIVSNIPISKEIRLDPTPMPLPNITERIQNLIDDNWFCCFRSALLLGLVWALNLSLENIIGERSVLVVNHHYDVSVP